MLYAVVLGIAVGGVHGFSRLCVNGMRECVREKEAEVVFLTSVSSGFITPPLAIPDPQSTWPFISKYHIGSRVSDTVSWSSVAGPRVSQRLRARDAATRHSETWDTVSAEIVVIRVTRLLSRLYLFGVTNKHQSLPRTEHVIGPRRLLPLSF